MIAYKWHAASRHGQIHSCALVTDKAANLQGRILQWQPKCYG